MDTKTPAQTYEEQLLQTHEKKQYTFSKQELEQMRSIQTTAQFLQLAQDLMANATVGGACQRVGHDMNDQKNRVLYDLTAGTFSVFVPKEEKAEKKK